MKPKLKLRVAPMVNGFAIQILEQDERFLRVDEVLVFKAGNGWEIISDTSPIIDKCGKRLFLRGDSRPYDCRIMTLFAPTKEEAEKVLGEVRCALQQWAEQADEFKDAEPEPEVTISDIFTLEF